MSKRNPRPPGVPGGKPIDNPPVVPPDHADQFPGDEDGPIVALTPEDVGAQLPSLLADVADAPPVEDFRSREIVERSEVMNPDPEADRWLSVDTDRMTGKVPHLAERGGMGPTEEVAVMVNEQVTSCPYYDPGDGIWGGIDLGAVVAYFPVGLVTWTPAIVVELFTDAGMRVAVLDQRYVDPKNPNPRVPHQAKRKPGEACWAHRSEDFCTIGRMAAEMQLNLGGAAYEEEQLLLAQPTPTEDA